MTYWFVAMATPDRSGRLVEAALADHGSASYRPRFRTREISRGRKTWREGFLFGCYFFVELRMRLSAVGKVVHDWAEQFSELATMRGIRGVLGGVEPLVVFDQEIKRLKKLERSGYVQVAPRFTRGQRVKINGGALAYWSPEEREPRPWVLATQRCATPATARAASLTGVGERVLWRVAGQSKWKTPR